MKMAAQEIIKKENFGITAVFDRIGRLENVHIQTTTYKVYRKEYRRYQKEGLQAIRNDNGF